MDDIQEINQKRLLLLQQLFLYGDFIPLSFKVDLVSYEKEIGQFDKDWVVYNKHKGNTGRLGLSVTSLDGGLSGNPDLQSLYEFSKESGRSFSENDFNCPTSVYNNVKSLHPLLSHFQGGLGRCRIVKFSKGGFFPPHRDQSIKYQVPDYIRVFVPLLNTGENSLYFIHENKKIFYEPGRAYLFNPLKTHSVFSFSDNVHTFAMSLVLNQLNIKNMIDSFLVK